MFYLEEDISAYVIVSAIKLRLLASSSMQLMSSPFYLCYFLIK